MRDRGLEHEVYRYDADMRDDEGSGTLLWLMGGWVGFWLVVILAIKWMVS